MPPALPPWPEIPPAADGIVLRAFTDADVPFARELSTDPYVPLIGTLPAHATDAQARDWIRRQQGRWAEGSGFSFAIALPIATSDARTGPGAGRAVGAINLGLANLAAGRASAGYAVVPGARGRGLAVPALRALTAFAWTIPALHRVELHIEPWNTASLRTAERAGYSREGLLPSFLEIGGRRRDVLLHAAVRPV